ncbi:MAG: PAS domain S-box protein [Nitrospiraceae bacterium]|nr:MAG: PAS domain S-box protein [Nitrospiraceae bacterium]
MAKKEKTKAELYHEIEELRIRLREAEETLDAIRSGAVDALVVSAPGGDQVYTLLGAEHTYRVLVESIHEGALTLTEDGVIIYSNRAFAGMAATSCGNLVGVRLRELITDKYLEIFDTLWQNVLLENAPAELELKSDGGSLPVYISCSTRLTDGVPSVFAIVTDISERKKAEKALREINETLEQRVVERTAELQAANASLRESRRAALNIMEDAIAARQQVEEASDELRESEERLALAISGTRIGMFDWDVLTGDILWTEQLEMILGIIPATTTTTTTTTTTMRQHTYRDWTDRVHPDDLPLIEEEVRRSLAERLPYEVEYRVVWPDGSIRWVAGRGVFRYHEEGQAVRSLGIVIDITEKKEADQERERLIAELERSNRELEQFAYIATHDLSEPLRMVSSYMKLIERRYKGQLDKDADEFINYAVNGADYMQTLLRDLLAYSRIGRDTKPFELTDLNKVFKRASDNLQSVIKESGARVICEKLPTVYSHETQMVQVFQNLIGNAIKFRRDRNPVVRVSAERLPDGWLIQVCDNGIGIAREYFDRIFLMFKRLNRSDKYPGTGSGLAICKKVVELQGGRIWVESEPGVGSTFYFTIPDKR